MVAHSYTGVIIVSLGSSSAYLMSLQYLLADPLVPSFDSVSRGGSLCHLSISWWLHWYPSAISVTLGGFFDTLVSLQYF